MLSFYSGKTCIRSTLPMSMKAGMFANDIPIPRWCVDLAQNSDRVQPESKYTSL